MATLTSLDGTTIAFDKIGSGQAVVLVDGAMCFRGSGPMSAIAQQLADTFTVYLYDRRGRGESGDTKPFAVEREVEDIDALTAQAGGRAALFGISSGAALVLTAAAKLGPAKVSHIALFEPPYMPEAALPAAAEYTKQLNAALVEGRNGDAAELFFRRVGVPPEAVTGMRMSPTWSATEAIAPTLAYDDAAMSDSALPVALAETVLVPTLTLAGEASPSFLRYGAEGLAKVIPGAQTENVAGQAHDATADALAPHLINFFSTTTTGL